MFKKILQPLNNLKIKYKIFLCMITISTFALLFISSLCYNYFVSIYEKNSKSSTKYTLDVVPISLRDHINTILSNTSSFVTSTPMLTTLKDISSSNKSSYISNYIDIQSGLEVLSQSDTFINAIFMVGKNGEFFDITKYGLNYDASNYFNWDLKNVNGISLLPVCKSPISPYDNVIPIVIPISQIYIGSISFSPVLSGTVHDSIATIFVLLSANNVNNYLNEINKNAKSNLYIASDLGIPISLSKESAMYKIATAPDVMGKIKTEALNKSFSKSTDSDTFSFSYAPVNCCNLNIVSAESRNKLLSDIKTIKAFISIVWALCFLLTLMLSLVLSQLITNPIVKLMNVVKKIENGTYKKNTTYKNTDEIGVLYRLINSMYDTINLQIDFIKEEEQEKAKSEIKILEEQINPHFIYNTLECIHCEILSEDIKTSSEMIESLGEFLRTSLNYGHNIISIQQELNHTSEYINIMNHRKNQKIDFRYNLDKSLEDFKIVKLFLQPLAENSIKHGFANDIINGIIFSPYIEINITLKNNRVFIEVSDNGRGIDIDNANKCLYQLPNDDSKKSNSVGLNNIYKRLRLYYDNSVNIEFYTTPYYRNSVIIDIPYIKINE